MRTSSDRLSPAQDIFVVLPPPALAVGEGQLLIRLAFSALRAGFGLAAVAEPVQPVAPLLNLPAALFVSIYHEHSLRGCLGALHPREPLWRAVQEIAVQAATSDPRFEPIEEAELSGLAVEISVLGPLTNVPDRSREFIASAIRVGEHGLSVRCRGLSGLLLPQVAERQSWDALRFVEETCRKAGLPPDAWSGDGAEVSAFRCLSFRGDAALEGDGPELPGGAGGAR